MIYTIMTIENAKGNDFRVEDIEGQIKRGRIEVESKVYKEFLISILNRIKSSKNELAEALNRYLEKFEV